MRVASKLADEASKRGSHLVYSKTFCVTKLHKPELP
jgi:hypothetical protein